MSTKKKVEKAVAKAQKAAKKVQEVAEHAAQIAKAVGQNPFEEIANDVRILDIPNGPLIVSVAGNIVSVAEATRGDLEISNLVRTIWAEGQAALQAIKIGQKGVVLIGVDADGKVQGIGYVPGKTLQETGVDGTVVLR